MAALIKSEVKIDIDGQKSLYTSNVSCDGWVAHAIRVIKSSYGDDVSINEKDKDLVKFGRVDLNNNTNWHTVEIQSDTSIENETFLSANTIDYIVSSSAADIAANSSSDCKVEGHTIDGSGNLTFVVQDVVLVGQTPVALTTPLARVTRWYNNDSVETVGKISIYDSSVTTTVTDGVPTVGFAGVHLTVTAGTQNSQKCSTSISSTDYWIVTGIYADILSKLTETVEFEFQVRSQGKVFRQYFEFSASNNTGVFRSSYPYIIVPKNSDVRIRAKGDGTAGITAGAGMFGVLAKVI